MAMAKSSGGVSGLTLLQLLYLLQKNRQLTPSSHRSAGIRPKRSSAHGRLRPPSICLHHTDGIVARCLEHLIPVTLFLMEYLGFIPTLCLGSRYIQPFGSYFFL